MAKTALVTGISGQDGACLAKVLLTRGYRVVGGYRRTSGISVGRLDELGVAGHVELIDMELLEESNIRHQLEKLKPDEIYNLAAQSFVGLSFDQPLYTSEQRSRLSESTVHGVVLSTSCASRMVGNDDSQRSWPRAILQGRVHELNFAV